MLGPINFNYRNLNGYVVETRRRQGTECEDRKGTFSHFITLLLRGEAKKHQVTDISEHLKIF